MFVPLCLDAHCYKGGFIFQTERVGAFFYVPEEAAEPARAVLVENGYRPYQGE